MMTVKRLGRNTNFEESKISIIRFGRISKSIETLELISITRNSLYKCNSGIIRLIEAQKNPNVVKSIYEIGEASQ